MAIRNRGELERNIAQLTAENVQLRRLVGKLQAELAAERGHVEDLEESLTVDHWLGNLRAGLVLARDWESDLELAQLGRVGLEALEKVIECNERIGEALCCRVVTKGVEER